MRRKGKKVRRGGVRHPSAPHRRLRVRRAALRSPSGPSRRLGAKDRGRRGRRGGLREHRRRREGEEGVRRKGKKVRTAATIVGAFSLERRNRRCRTAGAPKANVQSAERQSGKVQSVKVQRGKLERGSVHAGKVHSTTRQSEGGGKCKDAEWRGPRGKSATSGGPKGTGGQARAAKCRVQILKQCQSQRVKLGTPSPP